MKQLLSFCSTTAIERHQRDLVHLKDIHLIEILYLPFMLDKTRKRPLIDTLFQYGICISYNRVLEISTQMGEAVVQRYLDEGVVCPPIMCKGIFTTSAVDNIDHNPSASTAISSFHGTCISLFQHPSDDSGDEDRAPLLLGDKTK